MTALKSAVKMSVPLCSAKSMAKFPRFHIPLTSISTKTAPIRLFPRLILGGQSGTPEDPFRTPREFEFPSMPPGNRPSITPPEFPRRTTRTPEMDPAGDTPPPPEFSPDPPIPEFVPNPTGPDFPKPPLQQPDDPDIPAPLRPPQYPPEIPIPPRPQQPPDFEPPISTPPAPDIVPPPGIEPPSPCPSCFPSHPV